MPRNLDWQLAVNLLTPVVLIKIGKVDEALEFIELAEKIIEKLIRVNFLWQLDPSNEVFAISNSEGKEDHLLLQESVKSKFSMGDHLKKRQIMKPSHDKTVDPDYKEEIPGRWTSMSGFEENSILSNKRSKSQNQRFKVPRIDLQEQ